MTAIVSSTKCVECRRIKNLSEMVKNEQGRWQCQDTAGCAREKAKAVAASQSVAADTADTQPTKGEAAS